MTECRPRGGYPRICDVHPGDICVSRCVEIHDGTRNVLIQTDRLDFWQRAAVILARRTLLDRGSTVWSEDATTPRRTT